MEASPQHDGLLKAVDKRLREAWAALQVAIKETKSRSVDLAQGDSVSVLGGDFRRVRSRQGAWRAGYPPRPKKRTALLRKLQEVFRRSPSQPRERVVALINPMLRGWGWTRWRRPWRYHPLGLCKDYRVQRPRRVPKALPAPEVP